MHSPFFVFFHLLQDDRLFLRKLVEIIRLIAQHTMDNVHRTSPIYIGWKMWLQSVFECWRKNLAERNQNPLSALQVEKQREHFVVSNQAEKMINFFDSKSEQTIPLAKRWSTPGWSLLTKSIHHLEQIALLHLRFYTWKTSFLPPVFVTVRSSVEPLLTHCSHTHLP